MGGNRIGWRSSMKKIGIAMIIFGIIGLCLGAMMFGDIGISCSYAAIVSILAGVGFVKASGAIEAHSK